MFPSRFFSPEKKRPEQFKALEAILADRNVLAILLTGFGKSLIYQGFRLAKQSTNPNASVLVISPLNSKAEEQVAELTKLGSPTVHLKENDTQCMADILE